MYTDLATASESSVRVCRKPIVHHRMSCFFLSLIFFIHLLKNKENVDAQTNKMREYVRPIHLEKEGRKRLLYSSSWSYK